MDGIEPTRGIAKSGAYPGIPNEVYHGQLTVGPSLSASGAHTLIEECPALYWWESYLNPDREQAGRMDFDIGTAAHLGLLEPDTWNERVEIIEADDYKTKAAQIARESARLAGKVPLLPKHRDAILAMGEAARRTPMVRDALAGAECETTLVWQDRETGVWRKARPDIMPTSRAILFDYKTTANSGPRRFERHAWDMGYYQQAAWYLDGVEAVYGERPKDFWFIAQEKKAPYLVSIMPVDPRAIEAGAMMNRSAIDLFAECLATGRWPGRTPTPVKIGLPKYAEYDMHERIEAGEFGRRRVVGNRVAMTPAELGAEFQSPN